MVSSVTADRNIPTPFSERHGARDDGPGLD